jgi:putative ABC transport system permease protein
VLLLPALYGLQQLRLQGMLSVPGIAAAADDPFRNPLLLLAPALFVFALAMLALHLLPPLLELLSRLLGRLPGVALVLALRFLSRTAQAYRAPVLLITLTLSLAAFTASMARTLDRHSVDRARYTAGADVRLVYQNAGTTGDSSSGVAQPQPDLASDPEAVRNIDYLFVPPDDYLEIPGVTAVSRVAPSKAEVVLQGAADDGFFLAVDRQSLPGVLADAWRSDYGPESLGALLNLLAESPDAALVSAEYAAQRGLRAGDRLILRLNDRGESFDVPFSIVGTLRYFPALYPEAGPFVIGNLDYSADQQGGLYPYELWLDTGPGANLRTIRGIAQGRGLEVLEDTPEELLTADLLRPERQGLFGLLSVGFLAAALVTGIGFLVYTLLSFQRRMVELGMLRAIGLGTGQLTALLVCEQTLVIGAGTALGTGLGVLASRMFVPFLQVRTGEYPDTPPFLVQVAWEQIGLIYAVTGALLLLTLALTLLLLQRMRIFEAVKLGEAV